MNMIKQCPLLFAACSHLQHELPLRVVWLGPPGHWFVRFVGSLGRNWSKMEMQVLRLPVSSIVDPLFLLGEHPFSEVNHDESTSASQVPCGKTASSSTLEEASSLCRSLMSDVLVDLSMASTKAEKIKGTSIIIINNPLAIIIINNHHLPSDF